MKRRTILALLVLLIGVVAFAAVGCGGDDDDDAGPAETGGGDGEVSDLPPVTALPSASCTDIEYEGEGDPQAIIATDMPLQGSSRTQSLQVSGAVRQYLDSINWKAGDINIGYQSCDDATAQAASWDSAKCSSNGNSYAAEPSMLGLIGTFNSGCAAIIIPILNQAPGGAMAMVSPANTFVCLTASAPSCADDEPDKYYPTGTRNYTRVVANDAYQGAAVAEFMQEQGVTKLYLLNDEQAYGLGVASNTRDAAEFLGIEVVGFEAWDAKASNYEALMNQVKESGADALFLGGLTDENGAQLIKDKVKVLGPNDGDVQLYMPDGFYQQSTIDESGVENTRDAYFSVAGLPVDEFSSEAAQEFITTFSESLGGEPVDPYSIYGAQAAQVLLDAIAASDGTRESVIEQMFATDCQGCFLGDFTFSPEGDPIATGDIVNISIGVGAEEIEPLETIAPKQETVDAALGLE
ncbi:MAG: branched-chain amino acid ABC transporter substrate-binding protein [Gaiellaceae bacterium]